MQAKTDLDKAALEVDLWTEKCDINKKRAVVEDLLADYDSKFQSLLDYHRCLLDVVDEKGVKDAESMDKQKRCQRYQKGKHKKLMIEGQTPAELARVVADSIQKHKDRYRFRVAGFVHVSWLH